MINAPFTPDVVIYHGPECYDGFTAAWLLHLAFPHAVFLPANYGRTQPYDCTGLRVVVVDFSWPRVDMERMAKQATELVVLDHHKTAEEALRGLPFAQFDMNKSGCRMAYDWLYGNTWVDQQNAFPAYWLIDHVEDRDLWRMALPDTPAIHALITSFPMTWQGWDELAATPKPEVLSAGAAIRRSIDMYCAKVSRERELYFSDEFGTVQVVNAPYLNASELADYLLRTGQTAWTVAWFRRSDGRYQYSLRSRDEFDVSRIAKAYGGGGHKNASGFDSDKLPTELWSRVCARHPSTSP